MTKYVVKSLNSLQFTLLIALFECIALFFLGFVMQGTDTSSLQSKLFFGFLLGFFTALVAIPLFNAIPNGKLELKLSQKKLTITKFNILNFAVANGIFLSLLFGFQHFLFFLEYPNVYIGDMIIGFVATFFTLLVSFSLYNACASKRWYGLKGMADKQKFVVKHNDLLKISFFIAVLEALILPIIDYGLLNPFIENMYIQYAVIGLIAGFVAPLLMFMIYNKIGKRTQIIVMDIELK